MSDPSKKEKRKVLKVIRRISTEVMEDFIKREEKRKKERGSCRRKGVRWKGEKGM